MAHPERGRAAADGVFGLSHENENGIRAFSTDRFPDCSWITRHSEKSPVPGVHVKVADQNETAGAKSPYLQSNNSTDVRFVEEPWV